MKISIIGGAGTLGAAAAFRLCQNDQVSELCLIDINENLVKNHVMDLQNAYPAKKIQAAAYEEMTGSEMIIITAGVPNRNDIDSRDVFLQGNLALFDEFGKQIKLYAPAAFILTVSNPVDALNYYLYTEFHFAKQQLLGYTLNDSFRLEQAIRSVKQLPEQSRIVSPVIGEHGGTQVPLFSKVRADGQPIKLLEQDIETVKRKVHNWFKEFNQLKINRTTGWTTAAGIGTIVDGLTQSGGAFETVGSAVLTGEYGITGVSLGAPVTIAKKGILSIQEWSLTDEELAAYHFSAETVKRVMEPFLKKGAKKQ